MKTFNLDGKTYQMDEVSDEARELARQASLTNEFIGKLEVRTVIAKTAQARYVQSLKAAIEKGSEPAKEPGAKAK
jgi:hypothetical protein